MQTIRRFFLAAATCWWVLSLAQHSLASDLNDPGEGPYRPSPGWGRLTRWRKSKGESRRKKARGGAEGLPEAETGKVSDDSLNSEWESSSTSSSSVVAPSLPEEGTPSAPEVTPEAVVPEMVFSVSSASMSPGEILAAVKQAVVYATQQVETMVKWRAAFRDKVDAFRLEPLFELSLSLKTDCSKIAAMKQRIRRACQEIRDVLMSQLSDLGSAADELLLELDMILFDVDVDDATNQDADAWCRNSDGSETPDSWWSHQVVKEILSVPRESRGADSGVEGATDSAEDACKNEAAASAEESAGADDSGAPTEPAEKGKSTLVPKPDASADVVAAPPQTPLETTEEEEPTPVPDEDSPVDDLDAPSDDGEEEEVTPTADAPRLFRNSPQKQP